MASPICKFYLQGNCKFGAGCKFQHNIMAAMNNTGSISNSRPQSASGSGRKKGANEASGSTAIMVAGNNSSVTVNPLAGIVQSNPYAAQAIGSALATLPPDALKSGHLHVSTTTTTTTIVSSGGGKRSPNIDVVFVVDNSGSMAGERIETTRNSVKEIYNMLREHDRLGIVLFDSTVSVLEPLKKKRKLKDIDETIKKMTALGGATALRDGIVNTMQSLKTKHENIIKKHGKDSRLNPLKLVVITDGGDNASSVDIDTVKELLKKPGIRNFELYFIAVQVGASNVITYKDMCSVAQHCHFMEASDIPQLKKHFKTIEKAVQKVVTTQQNVTYVSANGKQKLDTSTTVVQHQVGGSSGTKLLTASDTSPKKGLLASTRSLLANARID